MGGGARSYPVLAVGLLDLLRSPGRFMDCSFDRSSAANSCTRQSAKADGFLGPLRWSDSSLVSLACCCDADAKCCHGFVDYPTETGAGNDARQRQDTFKLLIRGGSRSLGKTTADDLPGLRNLQDFDHACADTFGFKRSTEHTRSACGPLVNTRERVLRSPAQSRNALC